MAGQHSHSFFGDGSALEQLFGPQGPSSTDTFMTFSLDHTTPTPATPNLLERASAPDCDPCDLAVDAMPGHLCGDLTPPEERWLEDHVASCGYCARMLATFTDAASRLDAVVNPPDAHTAAPPSAASVLGLHEGRYGFLDTPVGPVLIVVTDRGVAEIAYLANSSPHAAIREIEQRGILAFERQAAVREVADQLNDYFHGRLTTFHVPVDLYGISEFTRRVLAATSKVPFGTYRTYGQIACAIGRHGASRAVGNALGRNPVPVIIPCHRIIRSDGRLGWYTGGADIKRKLLAIEGVTLPTQHPAAPASLSP